MRNEDLICSDRATPVNRGGWYYHWGPQAWIDMWMSNTMLVKRAMPIVTHTFLPILRLAGDKAEVDRGYRAVRARRETVRWSDSPREKWRKRYGNFVREAEWALLELRKHFDQAQFEEIVVGTAVALSHETSADFLAMMNRMAEDNRGSKPRVPASGEPGKPGRWATFLFENFNPAHWLTGPARITRFDPARGLTEIHIPACHWHLCAAQDSLPDPRALPEQGCLHICKAPFEALFNGANGGLKMQFEPHLPETSCTVRMSWDPR
jgi:hypothetical protein